jgi:hypothetical protein
MHSVQISGTFCRENGGIGATNPQQKRLATHALNPLRLLAN